MTLKGISVIDAMQAIIDERDQAHQRIAELEQQLAALHKPPVWRDGPPPEPGVWFARVKNQPNEIATSGEWNDWFLEEWDQHELSHLGSDPRDWQHAPVPANLKPPVEPKLDPCEEFIRAHQKAHFGYVHVGGRRYTPAEIEHVWPVVEAAIKGGAE